MGKEFRIHKIEYVNKTFRMPKNLVDELGLTAQAANIFVNELVIQSCNYALENLVLDKKNDDKS